MPNYQLSCGSYEIVRPRPLIMAILNVTPDSFSGDGLSGRLDVLLARAKEAIENGADILDVGGESSRPGAVPVDEREECKRVLPAVEALQTLCVPISVDTTKPSVMREAIRAGASMINDINALRAEGAVEAVRESAVALCVMHMQGQPSTMQSNPVYGDIVSEVQAFLTLQTQHIVAQGIKRDRVIWDPGFGFGKTLEHNLTLLRALPVLSSAGFPVLAGLSRKSMLGLITGQPVERRVTASAAAALIAAQNGASLLRVHDVEATRDALAIWQAVAETAGAS